MLVPDNVSLNKMTIDSALLRALLTGIANTALSFIVIVLALKAGAGNYLANASGYVAGWCLSFVLHRYYVFAHLRGNIRSEAVRFGGAIGIAYAVNLLTLTVAHEAIGLPALLAQALAMASYTITFFLVCRHFVFSGPKLRLSADHYVRLAVASAAILTFLALIHMRLTLDVMWQFWIARQMAHGVGIYSEILEVNPPLWFWMALGIHKLATPFGIAPTLLLKALLIAWAAVAVLLVDSWNDKAKTGPRIVHALCLFTIIILLPRFDFGQREQLTLIAALPYATLIAVRMQGLHVSKKKALIIGLLAAAGFALKHYFIAVPFLLEILLLASLRKSYTPLRPETLALVVCACLYAVAVILFTPAFLTDIVPLVNLAYDGYKKEILFVILGRAQVISYLALLAILIYSRRIVSHRSHVAAYMVTAAGFAFSFFVQQKGWQNHALPMMAFLLFTLVTIMNEGANRYPQLLRMPFGSLVLAFAVWAQAWWAGPYTNELESTFKRATRGLAPHEVVLPIGRIASLSWPMMETEGLRWPSRYFGFWPITSIVTADQTDPRRADLDRLAEKMRQQTYHDLACNPPKRIMFEYPIRSDKFQEIDFHLKTFFEQDPDFKAFMRNYSYMERLPEVDVYEARPDARFPAKPGNCRVIY